VTRGPAVLAGGFSLVLFFLLLGELRYLAPFRSGLLDRHGLHIALFFAGLYGNLLAGLVMLAGRLRLQGAGQKLRQVDQEIRAGQHELSREIAVGLDDEHHAA